MTVDQLETYICNLLRKQSELGEHYVRSQIEWAQAEIECMVDVEKRQASARAARGAAAQASAAGAFSTVCASSDFSSGSVVAPQIGLICETHARKSHG